MTDPAFSSAPESAPEPTPPRTGLLDPPEPPAHSAPSRAQLWMHRISVFLFVLISAVAGVLLIILPWTPEWTDNYLLLSFPALRTVVDNGFFRSAAVWACSTSGLVSGRRFTTTKYIEPAP